MAQELKILVAFAATHKVGKSKILKKIKTNEIEREEKERRKAGREDKKIF